MMWFGLQWSMMAGGGWKWWIVMIRIYEYVRMMVTKDYRMMMIMMMNDWGW